MIFWLQVLVVLNVLGFPPCPEDMAPVGLVCMDQYEAPNRYGHNPLVMQSAEDGERWCGTRGKRLCTEDEWDTACFMSGTDPCHNNKRWLPWEKETANQPDEVKRLWQGSPSGMYKTCRTPSGVYDLTGNVEEWVRSRPKARDWPYTLKGGWWAKKTACHKSNDAHPPSFRFYETGFRCCRSPWRE